MLLVCFFFLQVFWPKVANINQLPRTDGFTSPPKDMVIKHLLIFEDRDESTLIGEKKPDPSGAWTCNLSIAGQHFNQQATRTPCYYIYFNYIYMYL